jgi:hypothetical protein
MHASIHNLDCFKINLDGPSPGDGWSTSSAVSLQLPVQWVGDVCSAALWWPKKAVIYNQDRKTPIAVCDNEK